MDQLVAKGLHWDIHKDSVYISLVQRVKQLVSLRYQLDNFDNLLFHESYKMFQSPLFHFDKYKHFVYKQLDQGWEIESDDTQENIVNMIDYRYFDKMFHLSQFHLDKYTYLSYTCLEMEYLLDCNHYYKKNIDWVHYGRKYSHDFHYYTVLENMLLSYYFRKTIYQWDKKYIFLFVDLRLVGIIYIRACKIYNFVDYAAYIVELVLPSLFRWDNYIYWVHIFSEIQ